MQMYEQSDFVFSHAYNKRCKCRLKTHLTVTVLRDGGVVVVAWRRHLGQRDFVYLAELPEIFLLPEIGLRDARRQTHHKHQVLLNDSARKEQTQFR